MKFLLLILSLTISSCNLSKNKELVSELKEVCNLYVSFEQSNESRAVKAEKISLEVEKMSEEARMLHSLYSDSGYDVKSVNKIKVYIESKSGDKFSCPAMEKFSKASIQ